MTPPIWNVSKNSSDLVAGPVPNSPPVYSAIFIKAFRTAINRRDVLEHSALIVQMLSIVHEHLLRIPEEYLR